MILIARPTTPRRSMSQNASVAIPPGTSTRPQPKTWTSWSTSRPITVAIPPRLIFSKSEAPVLRAAARFLKERAPVAGFELIGQIVKLETSDITLGGNVTVAGLLDDSVRQVQFFAGPDDYQRAIEAHRHERIVSVEGELVKDGRSFRLSNPRLFSTAS